MKSNMYRPTYYDLLKLNPLLKRRSQTEIDDLIETMEELGYRWDHTYQIFHNSAINSTIRTQGLDIFTSSSFRELYEDLVEEINIDSEFYHKSGKAEYRLRKLSSSLFKLLVIVITLGWFFFSFKVVLITALAILALWVILLFNSNKYSKRRMEIQSLARKNNYNKHKAN